jgi:predicted dehydrogenase
VHLTWTAGLRKVIYTVEGDKGAITMEDDELKIEMVDGLHRIDGAHDIANLDLENGLINSHWSDASHASWFNFLFDDFRAVIERGDFAGKDAQEALLCVQLINTAYQSAREGSRELTLI